MRHKKVVAELRQLRKGPGLTLDRLAAHGFLLEVLAQYSRPDGTVARPLSLHQAYSVLIEAFNDVGESLRAQAARNAFAIGGEKDPGQLTDRREDFARDHHRHSDTIEKYENQAIAELARKLLTPAGVKEDDGGVRGAIEQQLADGSPTNLPVVDEVADYTYRFRADRVVDEGLVTKVVRATTAGVRSYEIAAHYQADPRPGVVSIETLTDCRLEAYRYNPAGVLQATIELPRPLEAGQRHRFSYRLKIDSVRACIPMIYSAGWKTRVELAHRLQFHQDVIPACVWYCDGLPWWRFPGASSEANKLRLDRFGYVERIVRNCQQGEWCGLVWEWT